jgi:hypothetical protein
MRRLHVPLLLPVWMTFLLANKANASIENTFDPSKESYVQSAQQSQCGVYLAPGDVSPSMVEANRTIF